MQLVEQDSKYVSPSPGNLFVYILDQTIEKQQIVNQISSALHLSAFEVLPKRISSFSNLKELTTHIYLPVTQWLQSFMDAKFVITDSFHGTVFSILFNKPFIVIENKKRGQARFSSLLKTFNLENRLVTLSCNENTNEIILNKIDWNNINGIISCKRKDSILFLNKI
jgi:exopolysaccharide biosynthesis predicted pyruvyltransferase EpsI